MRGEGGTIQYFQRSFWILVSDPGQRSRYGSYDPRLANSVLMGEVRALRTLVSGEESISLKRKNRHADSGEPSVSDAMPLRAIPP